MPRTLPLTLLLLLLPTALALSPMPNDTPAPTPTLPNPYPPPPNLPQLISYIKGSQLSGAGTANGDARTITVTDRRQCASAALTIGKANRMRVRTNMAEGGMASLTLMYAGMLIGNATMVPLGVGSWAGGGEIPKDVDDMGMVEVCIVGMEGSKVAIRRITTRKVDG
eukprot:CAMPEP_0198312792 /NCGR_PEP_ID=MMETSP1450-20131203/4036_1 /TAXON_ID=753684 ORGANISM="Madagascaria erythrocladiodes, Strain CCMP3234" /NCGR_SAMPLE_ID=MMETSP1450 /ASSEMBLY_ACC=CAM_ASM_001115 /LENGTH=166 /DNA_ID=CAMNT_0044015755 /DNA_START=132 /DNA_END=632 /DNA_ORIENTATION=-